jgi:hypothetical protein
MQQTRARRHPMMILAIVLAAASAVLSSSLAMAADAAERKYIREGMGEGEVLFKIGKPDHEAFTSIVKGEPEEKTWTYFPHPQDYQTMTIVTFRAGQVARVDRKIQR